VRVARRRREQRSAVNHGGHSTSHYDCREAASFNQPAHIRLISRRIHLKVAHRLDPSNAKDNQSE
jgi:hypothetical protein